MSPPRPPLHAALLLALFLTAAAAPAGGTEILAKSSLQSCAVDSTPGGRLSCDRKMLVNLAVPSDSSGGEASMVVKVTEVEENSTQATQIVRDPPVITINKSAVYAAYDLVYIRDVAYRPEEQYVETRKCEPDAGADVVKSCERLRYDNGTIIEHTEPVCCPCGDNRAPTSCGNIFDNMIKGKHNTAHCVRFPGEWFHVFEIGTRSLGFNIRVQVKKGSSVSEVVVGPENKTTVSGDGFMKVNLVGDFSGYTSLPSFEDFYLVTPRKEAGSGQPKIIGDEYSRWMLLERFRFTYNGLECNKIGVGYEAFQNQPDFCSQPLWNCLFNQLWNFLEEDKNRVNKSLQPQHVVEGRFQRINQHPDAGVYSFSVGVTEILNTNVLVELRADDIEYVYQRSPGKIISIKVTTFESLSQVGTANVTTKNIGKLEASYSLTFNCLSGIKAPEEQHFIMKPGEAVIRLFELHTSTDQAAKYRCTAILKASNFSELDRSECQFSTTPTVLNNGTQVIPSNEHKKAAIMGFFEAINAVWRWLWDDFFTGKLCRTKCSSLFDFSCHVQYICMGWIVMFVMSVALLLAAVVLLWFLHQKGIFDPLYDRWEDVFGLEQQDRAHMRHKKGHHWHAHRHGDHPHWHQAHQRRKSRPIRHYHHVLHRQDKQQPDVVAGGHRHRHDLALGVHHRDEHKHQHSKAVAALHLDMEGPSRETLSWLHETDVRKRRRHERHAGQGHDREHHRLRAV